MRKSLTIRIFAIYFLCLALPLLITSFIFFEKFYFRGIATAREKIVQEAHNIVSAVHSMQPLSARAMEDLIFFLPDQQSEIEKEMALLNATSSNQYGLFSLTGGETGGYTLLNRGALKQLETFKGGRGIEDILESNHAAFIRYVEEEAKRSPHLMYFQGHTLTKGKENEMILMVGLDIQDKMMALVALEAGLKSSFSLLNQHEIILLSTLPALEGQYLHPLSEQEKQGLQESGMLGTIQLASKPLQTPDDVAEGFVDFIFKHTTYLAYQASPTTSQQEWSVINFVAKHTVFMAAMKQFIWIYLLYGIALIIGVILAYYMSQWVSRPMRDLTHVMGEAHGGDLEARYKPVSLGFEFNQLGHLFNQTLEALLDNMKQAEDERVARETYFKEIDIGRQVQKNLLTVQMPKNDDVEVAAIYLQAENVGGDFYCVESHQAGHYWLVVGDAAGKGISSCLYSLVVRSLIRSYGILYDDVGKVLSETNNAFLEQTGDSGMFVTALMGEYDASSGVFSYYSCGHTPGLIKRQDGAIELLAHSGMALGLLESTEYQVDQVKLGVGDTVIFFTSGLIGGVNEKNQYFSEKRLRELLQQRKWISSQEIVDGLVSEYQAFIGSASQEAEVVIVTMQIKSKLM